MFNLRWIAYPDLTDESISANLASINTSDHNNITNNTDIRQKNVLDRGLPAFTRLMEKMRFNVGRAVVEVVTSCGRSLVVRGYGVE
jgi:hypothetical protein